MMTNLLRPRLTISHLEAIIEVASVGNLTQAAKLLHLTPSAVHHRIGDAERRLGVQLFRKSGRRLMLTPAGEMISLNGQRILADLHGLETDVERLRSQQQEVIRMAMAFYSCFDWFADLHASWSQQHPDIDIQVVADCRQHGETHLLQGNIDLCLFPYRPAHPEITSKELFNDELVLVAAPGHPLARKDYIKPADLTGQPFYTFTRVVVPDHEYERFLRPGNVRPERWIDLDLPELIASVVSKGEGVSILSRWSVTSWLADGELAAVPVSEHGLPIAWHAAWRLRHDKNDLLHELVACLRNLSNAGPAWGASDRH
jgi:LysR family transcriptional regulator for metE and metH